MIKNSKMLETFEKGLIRKEEVDVLRNFRILDAMYEEAVALGAFPLKDPLEGLEVDLRIAKVVNHVSGTPR
jgi:hypothetical protein